MSADDADDPPRSGADVDELHHRIGPHEVAVHRVLIGEHPLREALADDDDLLGVAAVAVVEVAAGDDRHAERGEEARRDGAELRARILFAVGLRVALDRELRREEAPASRHGTSVPSATCSTPGSSRDAADRFPVEPAICSGLPRVRHDRHVDARARCRLNPVCCRWSANSVVTSMPAPASSTNDAAICVTANTRSRRFVPDVIRTLPLDSPSPLAASADGSRGTNASSTAAASASTTPTQSRLESTVRSSARTEKRGAYRASTATIGRAMSTPSTAPAPQSSRLSASSVRRSAPMPAPSAARMASSPSRRTDRARIRFATFEHAMTNTSADAASSTSRIVRAGEMI